MLPVIELEDPLVERFEVPYRAEQPAAARARSHPVHHRVPDDDREPGRERPSSRVVPEEPRAVVLGEPFADPQVHVRRVIAVGDAGSGDCGQHRFRVLVHERPPTALAIRDQERAQRLV